MILDSTFVGWLGGCSLLIISVATFVCGRIQRFITANKVARFNYTMPITPASRQNRIRAVHPKVVIPIPPGLNREKFPESPHLPWWKTDYIVLSIAALASPVIGPLTALLLVGYTGASKALLYHQDSWMGIVYGAPLGAFLTIVCLVGFLGPGLQFCVMPINRIYDQAHWKLREGDRLRPDTTYHTLRNKRLSTRSWKWWSAACEPLNQSKWLATHAKARKTEADFYATRNRLVTYGFHWCVIVGIITNSALLFVPMYA